MLILLWLIQTTAAHTIGKISQDKCQEYAQAVFSQQDSPLLLPNARQIRVSECAIDGVPLIVGGKEAREKEFPHMAVIGYGSLPNGALEWQCGGALISQNFVLTAAHCLESRDLGPAQKVKLGISTLDSTDNLQEIAVAHRISYPKYTFSKKYNDIGLLKLANDIEFTAYVRPACLNTEQDIAIKTGTAIGFGKLSYEASKRSNLLMKVDLDIIANEECNRSFSSPVYRTALPQGIINSMFCAGQLLGGKDTCQGDSGGPFQIALEEPYCMYSLIGITSFGKFCGYPKSPGVYTRVSYYIEWIEKTVWG